jgi:hypothetical protein
MIYIFALLPYLSQTIHILILRRLLFQPVKYDPDHGTPDLASWFLHLLFSPYNSSSCEGARWYKLVIRKGDITLLRVLLSLIKDYGLILAVFLFLRLEVRDLPFFRWVAYLIFNFSRRSKNPWRANAFGKPISEAGMLQHRSWSTGSWGKRFPFLSTL